MYLEQTMRKTTLLHQGKRAIKHVLKAYRVLTSQTRSMPDFIIIGAQRCGTTSLYRYLVEHPSILSAFEKEVHFFDTYYEKGISWYRAHFPRPEAGYVTGEATPYYIFHPCVPSRISKVVSQAKLIVLLRNPVDRAFSHYHHEIREGWETLSFEKAISAERQRLAGEREKLLSDQTYWSVSHQHHSYLSRGIYVDQLETWERFFPREQMLILNSEDLYDRPLATLERVTAFLGLPAWKPKEFRQYNHARYPVIDSGVREQLVEYFAPHNQRLYRHLGVDFGWN